MNDDKLRKREMKPPVDSSSEPVRHVFLEFKQLWEELKLTLRTNEG